LKGGWEREREESEDRRGRAGEREESKDGRERERERFMNSCLPGVVIHTHTHTHTQHTHTHKYTHKHTHTHNMQDVCVSLLGISLPKNPKP
jgi:hypothetical protein